MKFYPYELNEYTGFLWLNNSPDGTGDVDLSADVDAAYNYETETWNDDKVREAAEKAVSARFGSSAILVWEA